MGLEPRWGDGRQAVQGMAEGFPDTLHAVDRANVRQDMRRVRPLPPTGREPPVRTTLRQDGVEDALFRCACDQTGPELA